MAKRFMHVSVGVLCLVIAYQLGAERARAEWDGDSPGQLVGMVSNGSSALVFSRSGGAWSASNDAGWIGPDASAELPIPIADIAMLDDWTIVTKNDVLWMHRKGEWVNHGPFPGGPVSLEAKSWGDAKAEFK
ncbi:MAG: hypothetical protein DHS20C21_01770 [Gemmatimonadota bacterium]|nr:MAG: hypothetical protein DHS20C21_01770 [Gemmatimonadota bacterium]